MTRRFKGWACGLGAYALALIGALGFAWLLRLDLRGSLLLVGAVAVVALFGTFIPLVRLGYTRLHNEEVKATHDSAREK